MELLTSRSLRARLARAAAAFVIFGAIAAALLPPSGVTASAYAGPCPVPGTLCFTTVNGIFESGITDSQGVCQVNAVSCNGGSVIGSICTCPAGETDQNGTCAAPAVSCSGGNVSNGVCVCPNSEIDLGGFCRANSPSSCLNGTIVGDTCECPSGDTYDAAVGVCQAPVTMCVGGTISNGVCNCPAGDLNAGGECLNFSIP